MQNISGAQLVAVGLTVPYERALNYTVKVADGAQSGNQVMTNLVYVTASYFEALQVPLRTGRLLAAGDTSSGQYVAVVNAALLSGISAGKIVWDATWSAMETRLR